MVSNKYKSKKQMQ